jgi:uncharacterized protein
MSKANGWRAFGGLNLIFVLFFQIAAQPDSQILAEVLKIKAIDNHSHVERVLNDGETDAEGDAIACGGLQFVSPPPVRLRVDNPLYTGAWRELFGFRAERITEETSRNYLTVKNKIKREKGDDYPAWILDKLNIETTLANRIAMGRGLRAPRFRWVAYGDPLLLPFSTAKARAANPDVKFFLAQKENLFKRFLAELKIKQLPPTFDEYLKTVVTPVLERHKTNGAVALKFVAAYYRALDFADASKPEAAAVYAKYWRGGEPNPAEYKKFQDYVFRFAAREAARLDLVLHIHTGGGCGHFFNLKNADPLLLEPFLNSADRRAKVVLIHGGYPFTDATAFLLEKPDVYADFSAQTFLLSPRSLSRVLRAWLEYEPEKILFGTDASPATPDVGWEESLWLTNKTAREALAIALTEMIADGEITRGRAAELARMVLRENAAGLYKFSR